MSPPVFGYALNLCPIARAPYFQPSEHRQKRCRVMRCNPSTYFPRRW